MTEEKFDVVVKALQDYHDTLWKLTERNTEWGIMDHIRLDQMQELKYAMQCWKKYKHEWVSEENDDDT